MSDSAQLSAGEEMDKVPELPRSPILPGAHIDAAAHNNNTSRPSEKHGALSKPTPYGKGSNSNVDIDFFYPDGVHILGGSSATVSSNRRFQSRGVLE